MKKIYLAILILMLAFFAYLLFEQPHILVNPGKLMTVHQNLQKDCFKCHTFFRGTPENKCTACHKIKLIGKVLTTGRPVEDKLKHKLQIHQYLSDSRCALCHSEHAGPAVEKAVRKFSHDLILDSVKKECASCHDTPKDSIHMPVNGNCLACHSTDRWKPSTFDHDKYFRFDRHHPENCADCHANNNFKIYTCYGCHEHTVARIEAKHLKEGIDNYQACASCHSSGNEHESRSGGERKHLHGRTEDREENDD